MRIVCWQTILMKYHALFLLKTRKDVLNFVVCCSCDWRFKGHSDLDLVCLNRHFLSISKVSAENPLANRELYLTLCMLGIFSCFFVVC